MYVYFIEALCKPAMVKIGVSFDIQGRMRALQTAIPFDLTFIGRVAHQTESEARLTERKLHRKLKRRHARGEWFRLTPKTREFILSLVDEDRSIPPPLAPALPPEMTGMDFRVPVSVRLEKRRMKMLAKTTEVPK